MLTSLPSQGKDLSCLSPQSESMQRITERLKSLSQEQLFVVQTILSEMKKGNRSGESVLRTAILAHPDMLAVDYNEAIGVFTEIAGVLIQKETERPAQ